MSSSAEYIILAEDVRHQRLVRRYLIRRFNCSSRDIRLVELPGGRSAAEQWVRKKYPDELKAWRNRAARARTALIAVIDADTGTIDARQQQLQRSAEDAGVVIRSDGDAVVHLIPKRNVETWILSLTGATVNEIDDYKNPTANIDGLIGQGVRTLYDWSRPNAQISARCVASLHAGIGELKRLEDDRGYRAGRS